MKKKIKYDIQIESITILSLYKDINRSYSKISDIKAIAGNMPKVKTTKSSKRYAFSSFRERVNAIKIEPSRKLNRRAFDDTDTSHFLSCYERWSEINRSNVYTDFVEKVAAYCQSLPQILHYKTKIFEELKSHISKHDQLSLQPLLEILTQFCHDLGPDFMEFYEESLKLVTSLALGQNESDALEWEFNCLAFIFKYLSKYLSQDLIPTFQLLRPLLTAKDHISRFSAEALAFLVRKTNQQELSKVSSFVFQQISDEQYKRAAIILFSDSMKSTKGSIHSKSFFIIRTLLENIDSDASAVVVGDVLLSVISYGSQEAVETLYELVLKESKEKLGRDQAFLQYHLRILTTLIFADSGRKVPDWEALSSCIEQTIRQFNPKDMNDNAKALLTYLMAVFFRNAEIKILTKLHTSFLRSMMSLDNLFLPFILQILELSKQRTLMFSTSYVQEFINKNWKSNTQQIAYFLEDLKERGMLGRSGDFEKVVIIVPLAIAEELKKDFCNLNTHSDSYLFEIFWRLSLISHSSFYDRSFVFELFNKVDQEIEDSTYKKIILSKLIGLFDTKDFEEVQRLVLGQFPKLVSDRDFVQNAAKFLTSFSKDYPVNDLINLLSLNLSLPDHDIRLNSLQLIVKLTQSFDHDLSTLSNHCLIIEQIPLSLDTARDISIRTRNLAALFKNMDSSDLKNKIYFNFLFGLLTVKFAPSWEAVFEVLPNTYLKSPELVWDLVLKFMNQPILEEGSLSKESDLTEETNFAQEWNSKEVRLASIIGNLTAWINKYTNPQSSLKGFIEEKYTVKEYPVFASSHAIKVLKKIPQLAEQNAPFLESAVLNQGDFDNDTEFGKLNLSRKDGNSILELFGLFKKLKNSPRADELYVLFLRLLSSKTSDVRKIALNCLLNFKYEQINKYRDNLTNLLDDSLFRDEISKLLSTDESSVLEDSDLDRVMPLILRIIYARAQITATNGTKRGLKSAAINSLSSFDSKYVHLFLSFLFEKIYGGSELLDFEDEKLEEITISSLKKAHGFSNLLYDILSTLGEKFVPVTSSVTTPLVNSLMVAQKVIDRSDNQALVVSARNTRQSGMKTLLLLFTLAHEFNWDDFIEAIYENVLGPRFVSFEDENLQQPSSMLKLMVCWSEFPHFHELLLINENEPAIKMLSLLGNANTKDDVIEKVLDFCVNVISLAPQKRKFQNLFSVVSKKTFQFIPSILSRSTNPKLFTKAIALLLALVEKKHVEDQTKRQELIDFSTKLLEKPTAHLSKDLRRQILKVLHVLVDDFEGDFDALEKLFKVCSKFLKSFVEKEQRALLVELFVKIGDKFGQLQFVTSLISDLNSYSSKRLNEYDYDKRLAAYKKINDDAYINFSSFEWTPILNLMLYFMRDQDLSVRANSSYSLRRFIDVFASEGPKDVEYKTLLKDLILQNLRTGLRAKDENIHFEFVSLLSHIVSNAQYIEDFKDMQVLLFNGDEEANFFTNIGHIQLHRRQRAIKRLGDHASNISSSSISHYLLPLIERYAFYQDEKLRNISNETVTTIESLMRHVTYKQYQAIFRRYLAGLKDDSDNLRDSVSLIVTVSKALMKVVNDRKKNFEEKSLEGLPTEQSSLDKFIESELISSLSKVLNKRCDETIVLRTPLIEALACLVLCLSHERIVSVLPGVLTNICQVMRAKSDETRDATRKYIGRAASILGAKYVKFIINELKTALSKGSQVHVLGFTVHSILASMDLAHGELDESSQVIMEIVMENMFGSTGQEKEADNYRTTMKEIKFNKSFDIAEILSRVVSLSSFNNIVNPIKLLLRERITLKVHNKLDELIRRISLGIYKNPELKSHSMLVLCYELFAESKKVFEAPKNISAKEESHFLVQLESKPLKVETESSLFVDTFQKLSLDLLRTTLSKNEAFVNTESLTGFLPFLEEALESDNEAVIVSSLKVLGLIMDVTFESKSDIFKTSARRCLSIIKNYPSTESELCQACYKYISNIIRHKEDFSLKESSLGYLLVRIQPDLQEQNRQGMAFNFLKALVAKHVMIPEVYDTMDKVREVMVTSHSKERRDMSRSIYFQFIMEYDQGKGRLEKQFKFLVNNLSYPAETGKQSVMELIHLILQKSGRELLNALSSSFFVALAKVLISETSTKSREMSLALITSIFEKMGSEPYEKYISGWLNSQNSSLLRCSLQLYRIKLKTKPEFGNDLDDAVLASIKSILENSRANSSDSVKWELVYSSLSCLSLIVDKDTGIFQGELKDDIVNCLLFPHSWVRLASSRLIGGLMKKASIFNSDDYQSIAYKTLHQLRAPSVDEALGSQIVKNLTHIVMYGENNGVHYNKSQGKNLENDLDEEEEEPEPEAVGELIIADEDLKMGTWIIQKTSGIIRSERSTFLSKKSCVQLLALVIQIFEEDRLKEVLEDLMLPLFNLTEIETDEEQKEDLKSLAGECLKMIENKVGVTLYTQSYSKVRQFVLDRRQERRTKRARLAITAPGAVARRKIKKHERAREKRKHEKDENGYYHTKKKSQRRD